VGGVWGTEDTHYAVETLPWSLLSASIINTWLWSLQKKLQLT